MECEYCKTDHPRLDILKSQLAITDDYRHPLEIRLLAEILLCLTD